jgi:hypothetical protein
MRRRMGANEWLLLVTGVLVVAISGDYVFKTLAEQSRAAPPRQKGPYDLEFTEGSRCPDFELPDRQGQRHRLSELATGETLVTFASNDDRSRALLRYVAGLGERRRKMGVRVPLFLTIADFAPEQEAAFVKETGLEQVVLYEPRGGAVSQAYRAVPTPRCFQVGRGRRVAVIGTSPAVAPLFNIGMEVLEGWRHRSPEMGRQEFQAAGPEELRRFGRIEAGADAQPAPGRP